MIDEILNDVIQGKTINIRRQALHRAKPQLLTEILKGIYTFTHRWGDGSGEDTLEAIPVEYINELFNVKEK